MALMSLDARFAAYDDEAKIADGECFIVNVKGMSFRHVFKVARNLGTAQLYSKYTQEAAPFRIKKIHIFNASYVFDKLFMLFRPFLSKEIIDSMQFHSDGIESISEILPKECLPKEFGGYLGPIDDLHENFMDFVISKR